jgi:cysteinyl-tRNA synthetase
MPLTLYNTLTRRKEPFEPLDPENVRVYVCGPTVYDDAHIGNARAVVVFDLLYRVLRHEYGADHVTYVRNITDVEDKIMAAARASGQTIDQVTARTTAQFHEDMAALGNLPPDIEPRATEYIPQMTTMIERLIASGHAYTAEGHVLFRVASYAKYGALSRRSRADMIAGARVEVAPYKEDPGDFVLWKPSGPELPGWPSPWGRGRPGWHIECSAMCENTLGETFDIHGGGLDLVFPHHENEIAQSVCAHNGRPFARYWLHNGMLTVGGAKMAKSEGNFITVRDALAEDADREKQGEVIRLALLRTHYRDPLDWTPGRVHEARQILNRLYRTLLEDIPEDVPSSPAEASVPGRLREALDADLNAWQAVQYLQELSDKFYQTSDPVARRHLRTELLTGGNLMGFLEKEPLRWFKGDWSSQAALNENQATTLPSGTNPMNFEQRGSVNPRPIRLPRGVSGTISSDTPLPLREWERGIEERINARALARKERRFADADRIRAELEAEGIVLEDHSDRPTTWRTK